MRGTIGETLERLILLQIGAAAATRDKVQEIVDSLSSRAASSVKGRTVVNDVMNRARERSTGRVRWSTPLCSRVSGGAGFPPGRTTRTCSSASSSWSTG